jgi:hypothetical protein
MADTIRGDFPNTPCSDCGGGEVCIQHSGPLVPAGVTGFFCQPCVNERNEEWQAKQEPRALGTKPREKTPA